MSGFRRHCRLLYSLLWLLVWGQSIFVASLVVSNSKHRPPSVRLNQAIINGEASSASEVLLKDEQARKEERYTRFSGIGRIYASDDGDKAARDDVSLDPHLEIVDRLSRATVAVIGIGGVGSWAAEALVRSGVGGIILVDADDICISNTNRQLHATSSSIGQMKVDEMHRRLLDINPDCNVTTIFDFVSTENVHELLDSMLPKLTVCLDAIDGAKEKTALIAACTEKSIPIVTCGGAAGKRDATQIVVEDLTTVQSDRMLATCRKELRQQYGFERGLPFQEQKNSKKRVRPWGITAVYSTETTRSLPKNGNDVTTSSFRLCDSSLGTACFVTGTFGFAAAGKVVDMIASDKLIKPRKQK